MKFVSITNPDINNGSGCRVTLWVSGCRHACEGCHNEWMWSYDIGMEWDEVKDELWEKLDKKYIKGLTISGGDPLDRGPADLALLKSIIIEYKTRFPDKDLWLYTGGVWEELTPVQMDVVRSGVDIVVDGPYILSLRDVSLPFRGSSNQRVIEVDKQINNHSKIIK